LWQQRDFAGAIARFRFALRSLPRSPILLNNLAFMLAICPDASLRNNPEAIQLAERACKLTHYKQAVMIDTLAAAYSEAGRFDDAILMAEKACALATESDEQDLVKKNQELLVLYRAHKPYHEIMNPGQAEPSAVNPASGDTEKLVPAAP
jgi:tetratricopeptide (TPR) repeat protein